MADADALRDVGAPGRPSSEPPAPGPGPTTPADDPAVMTLVDHLSELRWRLFRSLLAVALGMTLGFASASRLSRCFRTHPGQQPLFFTGLGDAFAIHLKIAFVIGIILAMPVLLYQGWAFISPGLTARAARGPTVDPARPVLLRPGRVDRLHRPAVRRVVPARLHDAGPQPLITAGSYFEFVTTMFLAFGLVMEFPIVLVGLSRVGIATSARLAASRRYVILAIAIFAAIVTPGGDLVSPLALGVTMYILFELTVFVIRRTGK